MSSMVYLGPLAQPERVSNTISPNSDFLIIVVAFLLGLDEVVDFFAMEAVEPRSLRRGIK
ncbi:hypothetical protein QDX81_08750 [Pseudomonas sp. CW003PS]|nr:hypothetical protein QDX81_08750 [Pseudomonas sp. CW003PS]